MENIQNDAKSFPDITKGEGWLFVLYILMIFWIMFQHYHIVYFGTHAPWNTATIITLLGALMTQIAIIPSGHSAKLTFFGKAKKTTWEDGISPLPNAFHISTKMFHFSVLWGLLLIRNTRYYSGEENWGSSQPDQVVKSGYLAIVSPQQMTFIQLIAWLALGWRQGLPHLWLSNFGFRVLIFGLVISFGGEGASNLYLNQIRKINQKDKTEVYTQLKKGTLPVMPLPEKFIPRPNIGKQLAFFVNKTDERLYYLYHEVEAGKMPITYVTESHCSVIPAGRKKIFVTKYSPRVAVNMVDEVSYKQIISTKSGLQKFADSITGAPSYLDTGTWEYINENWDNVDTDTYGIIVQALPDSELPASSKGRGGIVCF